MELFESKIRELNPFYHAFKQLKTVEEEQTRIARDNNLQMPIIRLMFKESFGDDPRRYNIPRVGEIAVVFVGEDGDPPGKRDLAIYPRNPNPNEHGLRRLNDISPHVDPMCYTVLFINGEPGWRPGLALTLTSDSATSPRRKKREQITMLQFFSFRLAIRPEFSPIHFGRKLFHQYLVDCYVRTEG